MPNAGSFLSVRYLGADPLGHRDGGPLGGCQDASAIASARDPVAEDDRWDACHIGRQAPVLSAAPVHRDACLATAASWYTVTASKTAVMNDFTVWSILVFSSTGTSRFSAWATTYSCTLRILGKAAM